MRNGATIAAVIPAMNEEAAIGRVVSALPRWVDDVVVVDNGSTDKTAEIARAHGARTVAEPRPGYGAACLAGIAALKRPDVVVFLDGDFSDDPEETPMLVDPILRGEADFVVGSRVLGRREPGALTPQARFGNWLACGLIRLFWDVRYTDLGPFRAVRRVSLERLRMRDRDYGWTVEMNIKAVRAPLRIREVPVRYRKRIGQSKISGTIRGVWGAGTKILYTIAASAWASRRGSRGPRERLIVFTRYPEAGRVKTRLIPALGAEAAARLHERMARHTFAWADRLARRRAVDVEVQFAGGTVGRMQRRFGRGRRYVPQHGADLGARMVQAFEAAFDAGARGVVITGTDCPGMTSDLARRAFEALGGHDLVLGPAVDGGYYLVGLRRAVPELFDRIPWGTRDVRRATLHRAEGLGMSVRLLKPLDDVDRPDDLSVWAQRVDREACWSPVQRVSVIIPTLNEAANVAALPALLRCQGSVEVIVADGGSTDGTVDVARARSVTVVTGPASRADQMNAGAAAASGEALVFLHADTRLPDGALDAVRRTLGEPGIVGGAFTACVDSSRWALRVIEWGTNARTRIFRLPYGDQAIFVRRSIFRALGGFRPMTIMEDVDFVRRLRRRGRVAVLPMAAVTSPRRWAANGVLRTTFANWAAAVGFTVGVSPARLRRFYDGLLAARACI